MREISMGKKIPPSLKESGIMGVSRPTYFSMPSDST